MINNPETEDIALEESGTTEENFDDTVAEASSSLPIKSFLDDIGLARVRDWIKSKFVPVTRKINEKPLSADVSLTASDVGAVTTDQMTTAIQSAIQDSWTTAY